MSFISRLEQITSWKRVLNSARRTVGKEPLDKEPSDSWKAKMLLAEHSPIRQLEFDWTWSEIEQWITVHFARHHVGCEKFVHSQREDRNEAVTDRNELPQGTLNDMDMSANAQALINISRKRLCRKASPETRRAWSELWVAIYDKDPIMASKMQRECIYRGFCPELKSCGFVNTELYKKELEFYRRTDITAKDVIDFMECDRSNK